MRGEALRDAVGVALRVVALRVGLARRDDVHEVPRIPLPHDDFSLVGRHRPDDTRQLEDDARVLRPKQVALADRLREEETHALFSEVVVHVLEDLLLVEGGPLLEVVLEEAPHLAVQVPREFVVQHPRVDRLHPIVARLEHGPTRSCTPDPRHGRGGREGGRRTCRTCWFASATATNDEMTPMT